MNTGPAFWLITLVGGAVLLGVALTYGLISRRGRREDSAARRLMNAGTGELDREEKADRTKEERPGS